ncbi:HAD family hydrolase [Lysinibacillus sp. NPDC048646]|uniref:HAD family hydrolase n=1 Tax=Lysinibacillus sp. NPDC048646 TaxID=3390574 RepID=UPI003D06EB53
MKSYIFDFDGTLADSKQCSVLATQEAFRLLELETPSVEIIEYYMGIPIEQSFKEMASIQLEESLFEELLAIFRREYKKFENESLSLFPKMMDVLEELNKQGKQCFVVSSKKTDVLLRNLQALQINRFFEDYIGSDQVKHYKPHPEGIFKLVERHQLDLQACVMIGDAIFDIQMGKAAGCKTCAVTWGSHSEEQLQKEQPNYCISDVLDLLLLKS